MVYYTDMYLYTGSRTWLLTVTSALFFRIDLDMEAVEALVTDEEREFSLNGAICITSILRGNLLYLYYWDYECHARSFVMILNLATMLGLIHRKWHRWKYLEDIDFTQVGGDVYVLFQGKPPKKRGTTVLRRINTRPIMLVQSFTYTTSICLGATEVDATGSYPSEIYRKLNSNTSKGKQILHRVQRVMS